jgi:hypothetical protein
VGGKLKTDAGEACTNKATGYTNNAAGTRMLGVPRYRICVSHPTFPPNA